MATFYTVEQWEGIPLAPEDTIFYQIGMSALSHSGWVASKIFNDDDMSKTTGIKVKSFG